MTLNRSGPWLVLLQGPAGVSGVLKLLSGFSCRTQMEPSDTHDKVEEGGSGPFWIRTRIHVLDQSPPSCRRFSIPPGLGRSSDRHADPLQVSALVPCHWEQRFCFNPVQAKLRELMFDVGDRGSDAARHVQDVKDVQHVQAFRWETRNSRSGSGR